MLLYSLLKIKFFLLIFSDNFEKEKDKFLKIFIENQTDEADFDIEFLDFNSYKLNIDTNLRSLKAPNSEYFKNLNSEANMYLMDMYSLYQFSYCSNAEAGKGASQQQFSKLLRLEKTPNRYLSDFYLDRFFIINGDSIKLFDNNFLMVNNKSFNPQNGSNLHLNTNYNTFRQMQSSYYSGISLSSTYTENPYNLFSNIKNFNFIDNQISKVKSGDFLNKQILEFYPNVNTYNNKNRKNSLFSNSTPGIANGNADKFISYEKGSFINNPSLILLSSKEIVSLCDFRVFIILLLGFQTLMIAMKT